METLRHLRQWLRPRVRKLKTLPGDTAGVSAIEFALIAPVLMILMLGMFDYAVLIFHKMELVGAVRSGAQYALIDSSATTAIAQTVINSTNLPANTLSVTVTNFCECPDGSSLVCGGTCAAGNVHYYTRVAGSYDYTPIFLPGPITLSDTTTIRTQ
ncbi:TadE/TadG family type IV pilus assembly protein [Varunaivibrio sulfuroxidans]|uniref:TadE-like protein n=1 Tax=Varunaivibrio sulfuroxidans TaxID=1773489 RepID=A0A4R3JDB0_9PROT|nr:TadE family protein [Varunaivibrio sulfuroxidans]TCS64019.1 TadE-like protein [Varunaivibrio sulfuroxidans]WES31529.1 pilus assembly protein [Varunaivibrio sulfuroxidans]